MADKRRGAGRLNRLITFQQRGTEDDGYGNPVAGDWEDQFTEPARMEPRLGGESIQAARLQGTQPFTVTVRSNTRTRTITPAWRAVDARAGLDADNKPKRVFNIKTAVNVDERDTYIELLCVEGEVS